MAQLGGRAAAPPGDLTAAADVITRALIAKTDPAAMPAGADPHLADEGRDGGLVIVAPVTCGSPAAFAPLV